MVRPLASGVAHDFNNMLSMQKLFAVEDLAAKLEEVLAYQRVLP